MDDALLERSRDGLVLSSDRRRFRLDVVHDLLRSTPWTGGMSRDVLERAVANSLCMGVYDLDRQVAFARVVTDLATYAYLTDVVVDEPYRRRGLGRWMVECVLEHPELQGLRRI